MATPNPKYADWTLRIAASGMFLGHGILALGQKASFVSLITGTFPMISTETATRMLPILGAIDVTAAILVLFWPARFLLFGGALWAFATALSRPLAAPGFFEGGFLAAPLWDFIERFANVGVPLALLWLRGWPETVKEWFS